MDYEENNVELDRSEEENEQERLKRINERLAELGEPRHKWPYVVWLFITLDVFVGGLILLITGISLPNDVGYKQLLVIFGVVLFLVGFIVFIAMWVKIFKIAENNNEIYDLQDMKEEIEPEADDANSESNEDVLLRLLSEGKITVEEYKKLSKK